MNIDLLAPAGRLLLGRLFVSRDKHGDLVGQITLGPKRYVISWRKISTR
jgi:hypothetical protein